MKAVQIKSYGCNEVIEINENSAKLVLREHQIMVKMRAAGINPVDWKIREGHLQQVRPLDFPVTLGMDFSGTVYKVGQSVSGFKEGDEVYGMSNIFSSDTGTFAEYFVVNSNFAALKPKKITHLEAAALPMAGVSALQALIEYMNITKGKRILIHGGSGGIGVFAIQLAKYLGAHVATTVSESAREFVKLLGADEIIDYKAQSFENLLQNYDAVLDTIGGETYAKSFKVLKKGGIIVSMLEEPNLKLMEQYAVNAIVEYTEVNSERLSTLAKLVDENVLKVPLDKIFYIDQIKEALEYQQYGHPQGKVVIASS